MAAYTSQPELEYIRELEARLDDLQVRAWEAQFRHLQKELGGGHRSHSAPTRRPLLGRWELLGFVLGSVLGTCCFWCLRSNGLLPATATEFWRQMIYGARQTESPGVAPMDEDFDDVTLPPVTEDPIRYSTFKAFDSRAELEAAVDTYIKFNSKDHTVCKVYGYPMGTWKVGAVTDFSNLFANKRNPAMRSFNNDLSRWDVSNAMDMQAMFEGATLFNSDLQNWQTGQVTNMASMFQGAMHFNGKMKKWETSRVTNMKSMFSGCRDFNQNISGWDTANVQDMSLMFSMANNFNQNLDAWDTSKVRGMQRMFYAAGRFNGNVSTWDVSRVGNMNSMFRDAYAFNGTIGSWDVSKAFDTTSMFQWARSFDQDLSEWTVVNVVRAEKMFAYSALNRNLCRWRFALPLKSRVTEIFHESQCPDWRDPVSQGRKRGPFCHPCFKEDDEL